MIAKALGVTAAVGAGTAIAAAAIPKVKDAIDDARSRPQTQPQTKTALLQPPNTGLCLHVTRLVSYPNQVPSLNEDTACARRYIFRLWANNVHTEHILSVV